MRDVRVHVAGPLHADMTLALPGQAAAHVARVLRLGAGEALTLFDGRGGEWAAVIDSVRGQQVQVTLGAHRAIERESPLAVTLLQALARGERMDWVLQKTTELGVARVVPVVTERSVVQLDRERADKRHAHWQGIVVAACEQCGRNRLPELLPPARLEAACAATQVAMRLVLAPDASLPLAAALRPLAVTRPEIALLIGPEGGLSERELAVANASGFVAVGLGPRVLRTETAAIAALGLLQGLVGDLSGP
ncbi:MAG: 16S rRNA (uracil(1498)-N(3))-methyltransferase [Steroidobacteraceae bacterium]|nr:16S rRNA (uracil(1498)-N(3))-methyltransferase [Nevskiaceae bacterium]MCP5360319.1 16S rRNA (uracil(1498)-N(3))-methyltransferase [Nevskiaceae bacterium]MCP5467245.1 16S rRNA (uracil(1498)-N(3))-methyltransferase [Nevskiaceae bacterium]MCP5471180.1 16S rRNA (uracil(1498)-N(3))-methyltransferase [Nevskiaceae bacterium]